MGRHSKPVWRPVEYGRLVGSTNDPHRLPMAVVCRAVDDYRVAMEAHGYDPDCEDTIVRAVLVIGDGGGIFARVGWHYLDDGRS